MKLPDPIAVLRSHIASDVWAALDEETQGRIEFAFARWAQLMRESLYRDVTKDMVPVRAAVLSWQEGLEALCGIGWWAAARDYAEQLGQLLRAVFEGFVKGT